MNKDQYVKAVMKKLKCTKARKKEIGKELAADIDAALEKGETIEEIVSKMGAADMAKEFNDNFSEEELKKAKRNKLCTVLAVIAVVIILLIAGGYWILPKSYPIEHGGQFREEEIKQTVDAVIAFFNEEDYEALRAMCYSEQMSAAMNKETLDPAKAMVGSDWGEFQGIGNTYMSKVEQMGNHVAVVQVNANYENAAVTYTLMLSEDLKLMGFYIK